MPGSGPLRRTVRVCNPLGLHMRPATAFAQAARGYQAAVTVWHGDKRADGKSSLDLILLVAECGAELVLEVDGADAEAALPALAARLADPGEEL
ncbi:MAG: HPr family phosphocarrier protein [Gemmataceae bacterium]